MDPFDFDEMRPFAGAPEINSAVLVFFTISKYPYNKIAKLEFGLSLNIHELVILARPETTSDVTLPFVLDGTGLDTTHYPPTTKFGTRDGVSDEKIQELKEVEKAGKAARMALLMGSPYTSPSKKSSK